MTAYHPIFHWIRMPFIIPNNVLPEPMFYFKEKFIKGNPVIFFIRFQKDFTQIAGDRIRIFSPIVSHSPSWNIFANSDSNHQIQNFAWGQQLLSQWKFKYWNVTKRLLKIKLKNRILREKMLVFMCNCKLEINLCWRRNNKKLSSLFLWYFMDDK